MKILIIGSSPGGSQLRDRPALIEPGEYKRILDADASKHPDRVGKNTDDWMAINATGLNCTGTLLQLAKAMKMIKAGESLVIAASDPVFADEVRVWCLITGNCLRHIEANEPFITAVIQKRRQQQRPSRRRLH